MLKIGEFSKLSRASIRMLRHYDEIGLLKPEAIDDFTGYRYYALDQLLTIGRITSLRDMGFGLSEIAELLEHREDKAYLEARLQCQKSRLEALAEDAMRKLRHLEAARSWLRKDQEMNYDVNVKTLPERYAACVRMTIPCYEEEGRLWEILRRETEGMQLVPDEPCYCCAVFHDQEYKESEVDVEAQKTVKGRYPDAEHVKFRTLPPVKVVTALVKGAYTQMNDAYAAIFSWMESNGYHCVGPFFNIYHVSPHETQNPEEYVTEVCFPVEP